MMNILLIAIFIIGILGIIDSVFVMTVVSSISAGVVMPGMIGIGLIIFACLKWWHPAPLIVKPLLRGLVIGISICILCSVMIIESLIVYHGQIKQTKQIESNYVIVLGCGVFSDGRLTLTLKNRLDIAYDYLVDYPEAICVVSGGQGLNEPVPEAVAMHDYLIKQGIDEDRILVEPKSTSTIENLTYSLDVINEYNSKLKKTAMIVSSDYHVFRSVFLAKNQGIKAYGLPSPTPWYIRLNSYMREYLAVVKSLVFDYTWWR